MIVIQLNKEDFEYDVHSLTRAFYPMEEVVVVYRAEAIRENEILRIQLTYEEESIFICLLEKDKKVLEDKMAIVYYADRKETKNYLKRLLYKALASYSGLTLPWGTLSGIRPIKIPVALIESGKSNVETAQYLRETYLLNDKKTALSVSIANQELHILKDIDYKAGYSIYIGIPFCPSICLYCSFSSYPLGIWADKVDLYLEALFKEIEFVAEEMADKKIDTIYIGGGTPTTLLPEQMERLLLKLEERLDLSHLKEFTVESGRPDSITEEKLEVLKKHNITRISINPQTMKQETLDIIGRCHSVEQIKEAFFLARKMGFDNINMDIIVGLPGEEVRDVNYTMEELKKLDPDSITVHSLAVKRAARLNIYKDEYKEMSFVNSQEIMDMVADYTKELNMNAYYLYRQKNMTGNFENVGYAKENQAGIYNILIMEEKQTIMAIGAGAATKLVYDGGSTRVENVKDINNYISRIDEMIDRKRKALGLLH